MEIATYFRIIARYWWIILITTIVATGVAFAITSIRSKSYTVQARVVAQPSSVLSDTRTLVDMSVQVGSRSVMGTFAQIFTSAEVRNEALQTVGMTETQALEYPLEANILPDSSVIEVSATGRNPELLTDYVNATIDAAIKHGNPVYRVIELVPLERATIPKQPSSPVPARDIPLGTVLGLALGLLLAFATEYVRAPRRQDSDAQIRALPVAQPMSGYEARILANGQARPDQLTSRQQAQGTPITPRRQDDSISK